MDSCLMVWNFKPNMRAYRFVGHKVSMNDNLHISQNIINIGYLISVYRIFFFKTILGYSYSTCTFAYSCKYETATYLSFFVVDIA